MQWERVVRHVLLLGMPAAGAAASPAGSGAEQSAAALLPLHCCRCIAAAALLPLLLPLLPPLLLLPLLPLPLLPLPPCQRCLFTFCTLPPCAPHSRAVAHPPMPAASAAAAAQVLEAVVRTRWGALPDAQREGIKTYCSNLIIKLSTDEKAFRSERTFLNKLNLVCAWAVAGCHKQLGVAGSGT